MTPKPLTRKMRVKKRQIVPKKKFPKMSAVVSGPGPAYALALFRPFSSTGAHIPDDLVTPSCLMSSHYHVRSSQLAEGGTSTSHNWGLYLPPYPTATFLEETSAGNANLTDLSADGTTYQNPITVPNLTALGDGLIRCVGIGVKIAYEGSELNRSGRFVAGVIPVTYQSKSVATTGTKASALTTLTDTVVTNVNTIRGKMTKSTECRVPGDGVFEAHWEPSGVPHYQALAQDSLVFTASGNSLTDSIWSIQSGASGIERTENGLVVLCIGDTTPTAVIGSNSYAIDVVWHWEVVPADVTAITAEITPSMADSTALDSVLNMANRVPIGIVRSEVSEAVFPAAASQAANKLRTMSILG